MFGMKNNPSKMRIYAWVEFVIWLVIVAVSVLGIRYYSYQNQKNFKNYQIFMDDIDGLIVGSPVKFLGVQIGHVKKIKVISSEVYVRFIVTQKDLELPTGAIATVESSGLGGSKALEIYPPDKTKVTDKLIVSKSPTRLGKVLTLFKGIFKELDSILTTINGAAQRFEEDIPIQKNVVQPVDADNELLKLDKKIESVKNSKNALMNGFKNKEKKYE